MTTSLPHHWIRVRLSAFCSIKNGIAFSANDVVDKSEPGAIACLRTSNIQEELDTSDVTYIPGRLVRDRDYDLRVGDILMSTANSNTLVGKCCLIRALDQETIFGGFISRVRVESDLLDPEYAYLWLSSSAVQSHLRQRARQTTNIANLPPGDVLSTLIVIPPLSEQRRIVEILNEARDIRRLRQQADDLTTQLIPAIFGEMFGHLDPSKYLPLARLWAKPPQNGLYKHADSYGAGTQIVRIGDFYNGTISDITLLQRLRLTEKESHLYSLLPDDILVNRVNSIEYLGKSAIVPRLDEIVVFESNMMRFSVAPSRVLPQFLIAYLQHPVALHELRRRAKHAVNQAK